MRSPHAPYLELGFYFAGLRHDEALRRLAERLRSVGGRCVSADLMDLPASEPFAGAVEVAPAPARWSITDEDAWERLWRVPDHRVVRLTFEGALGVVPRARELAAVLETRSPRLDHPVAVWLEGDVFSLPTERAERARAARERRARRAFLELAASLRPSYASITVDSPLLVPDELARDPTPPLTTAFVARDYVGERALAALAEDVAPAHVEHVPGGLFVTTIPGVGSGRAQHPSDVHERVADRIRRAIVARGDP